MWCKDSLSHRLCYIQSSPEHHPQDCSAGSQADHTDWEFLASTSRGDTQGATTVLLWAQGKSHLTKTLAWGSQSSLPSQQRGASPEKSSREIWASLCATTEATRFLSHTRN